MDKLASTLKQHREALSQAYAQHLRKIPDYAALPDDARINAAQSDFDTLIHCLEIQDDTPFLESVQTQVKERLAAGFVLTSILQALNALEEILLTMVNTVEGTKLLWRALSRARSVIARRAVEASSQGLPSGNQFQRLAANVPYGLTIVEDGQVVFVNDRLSEILGYSKKELANLNSLDFAAPEEKDRLQQIIQEVRKGNTALKDLAFWIIRPDGTRRYIRNHYLTPHQDKESKSRFIITSDMTEQKQIEETLKEQQAFLRQVIDINPNFVFVKDRKGRFVMVNQAMADAYNTAIDEMIGKTDADFNIEQAARFRHDDLEVMDSLEEKFISEETMTDSKGNTRWLQTIKLPLVDEDGVARRVLGVAADITERKQLELERQQMYERRTQQVQTSTQVAQEIAAAPALDELFRRVVTLIKERFDYYHAQIFRYEPSLDAVVLVVGYGETGEQMLEAGHRLELGRGVVGTAAVTGQAVLASDVTQDPDWVPNPFLPDAQGELAVPIKLQDEVLGILDVQSDTAHALTEEDQIMLEGLCGQIAIAIDSTRLRQEMEENLRELRLIQRTMSREGWTAFRETTDLPSGYLADQMTVQPTDEAWAPEMPAAIEHKALVPPTFEDPHDPTHKSAAVAPLLAQEEVIGALGVYDDPQRPLSPEELALLEAISEQVASALENARLFEQTQAALAETEALYQASAEINAAQTYEGILAALRQHTLIGQGVAASLVYFDRPWTDEQTPEWFNYLTFWSQTPLTLKPRYPLSAFPNAAEVLSPDTPSLITDVSSFSLWSPKERDLFIDLFDAKSAVFFPMVVRGRWIGYINAAYNQPTQFPKADVRRLMALSGQTAVAVQSLHQLEEIQAHAQQEERLRQITNRLRTPPDVDGVMRALAQELGQALGRRAFVNLNRPKSLNQEASQDNGGTS